MRRWLRICLLRRSSIHSSVWRRGTRVPLLRLLRQLGVLKLIILRVLAGVFLGLSLSWFAVAIDDCQPRIFLSWQLW